jgi:NAD(P)-dependent dehydrogenase (short-subunit alcohol dehydrogenase family)
MIFNKSYPDQEFYKNIPKQEQKQHPGIEAEMKPEPIYEHPLYNQLNQKLKDKVAIITGGDSGIGRAVSIGFAKQGASVVIVYLNEDEDALKTQDIIKTSGGSCKLIRIDISNPESSKVIVQKTLEAFGQINILVNNAARQTTQDCMTKITDEQLMETFATNIFGPFYLTREVLPHLKAGDTIINTTSVTAYKGHDTLIDYSSTKGALTTFTRSLAINLAKKQIRVNAVAPGPIWTPLIPSSMDANKTSQHGSGSPLGRTGQPVDLVGAYVFLASDDAAYMTGQTIHINGGEIING